jgi:hypothetical protein
MLVDVQVEPKMLAAPGASGCETQEGKAAREEARERSAGNSDRPVRDAAALEHFSSTTCRHAVHAEHESPAAVRVCGR